MTSEQFAYWLQGFTELSGGVPPTAAQWDLIVAHLGTVFNKVTPKLNEIKTPKVTPSVGVPLVPKDEPKTIPLDEILERYRKAQQRPSVPDQVAYPGYHGYQPTWVLQDPPKLGTFIC